MSTILSTGAKLLGVLQQMSMEAAGPRSLPHEILDLLNFSHLVVRCLRWTLFRGHSSVHVLFMFSFQLVGV